MCFRRCCFDIRFLFAFVLATTLLVPVKFAGQTTIRRTSPKPAFSTRPAEEMANADSKKSVRSSSVAGVCDTAGPVEVESTGGLTAPTAYTTLATAFANIVGGTHTGSIKIEICGNTTETTTATLTASGTGAASYTGITISPVGGPRIIEGDISGAVIRLQGADNVTIDGRQGATGTARDLTIRNNNTTASTSAAIWLGSVAAGNGASNNTMRNLEIATGSTANTSTLTTIGIIMCGSSLGLTVNGVDNDNNSFIANRIVRARYGIVTRGTNSDLNQNPILTDNTVGPSSFGSDEIGKVGIFMQFDQGAVISRNTVQFVGGQFADTTANGDRVGIGIGQESWSAAPNTSTSNTYTVTNNVIHDVVEERGLSAVGLLLATTGGGSATNNVVANNFIYNVRSNGSSGDQTVGLGIAGGFSDKVVFNSIALTGDVDPSASASAAGNYGSGIRIANPSGATHANLTLMNNSVYLDLTSSSNAAVRFYAISGNSAAYSFGTGGENYNNLYINPANTQLQTGGLGSAAGGTLASQFATLADWKGAYTSPQDANSQQADPLYVSTGSDLHISSGSSNENSGTPVAGVVDDIDGQTRPPTPDIGADERLNPTAARVPITGRVLSPNGFGIGGVRVVLSGDDPSETRAALTNGFGYYVFDDVEVGKAYIISPLDGRERFTWQGRFVLLTDQLSDVDFVAEP
jgi:hypothetical protein